MKKIRLSERELTNIIKRVISEQTKDIPEIVKQKQMEYARDAKKIIDKHMEFCKYMKSHKSEFPDFFSNEDSLSIDCEFVTNKFANQPLKVIAYPATNSLKIFDPYEDTNIMLPSNKNYRD
jgi:aspartyl/asparaginyl-tRNA synthetase